MRGYRGLLLVFLFGLCLASVTLQSQQVNILPGDVIGFGVTAGSYHLLFLSSSPTVYVLNTTYLSNNLNSAATLQSAVARINLTSGCFNADVITSAVLASSNPVTPWKPIAGQIYVIGLKGVYIYNYTNIASNWTTIKCYLLNTGGPTASVVFNTTLYLPIPTQSSLSQDNDYFPMLDLYTGNVAQFYDSGLDGGISTSWIQPWLPNTFIYWFVGLQDGFGLGFIPRNGAGWNFFELEDKSLFSGFSFDTGHMQMWTQSESSTQKLLRVYDISVNTISNHADGPVLIQLVQSNYTSLQGVYFQNGTTALAAYNDSGNTVFVLYNSSDISKPMGTFYGTNTQLVQGGIYQINSTSFIYATPTSVSVGTIFTTVTPTISTTGNNGDNKSNNNGNNNNGDDNGGTTSPTHTSTQSTMPTNGGDVLSYHGLVYVIAASISIIIAL